MEAAESGDTRKRFHKPHSFLNSVKRHPMKGLVFVYHTFTLEDISEEMARWQRLALANDNSLYEEGAAREDLMDFCEEIVRLSKALYSLQAAHFDKRKAGEEKQGSHFHHGMPGLPDGVSTQSSEEDDNPLLVIERFCTMFSCNYSRQEMADLLDAVITYPGVKNWSGANLVLFYQCMHFLILFAYRIKKKKLTRRVKHR